MSKTIAKLLDPNCVLLECDANTSADVISAVGERLEEQGYVKNSYIQAALDREKELPTGLPLGGEINAAIPHTDIEHVLKPALGMATLRTPVIFKNMVSPQEDVPVRLVFLLALEQPKAQIEMLQEVASVIQNADLVKELVSQETVDGVIKVLSQM
jgi:PTS system galactitol-specific IIA component